MCPRLSPAARVRALEEAIIVVVLDGALDEDPPRRLDRVRSRRTGRTARLEEAEWGIGGLPIEPAVLGVRG